MNIGWDSPMRKWALSLGAIVIAAGLAVDAARAGMPAPQPAPSLTNPWREFAYPEDGFAIAGPSQAARMLEKSGSPGETTHAYAFPSGVIGAAFLVKVTRNTASRRANEDKLKEITGHNPSVMKAVRQAGLQGVQFGFEDTDTSSIGRIFAADRMIYTILAQGPTGDYPPAHLNRWLDSFRLLDKKSGN